MKTVTETAPVPTGRRSLPLSVVAVAAATFSVVTTEMLPVGLLTSLSSGLHVSDGTAGLTVTLPGLVAALAALLLPVAARRADRRAVLCALMLLLGAVNLLSALAPSFAVLLGARIVVGLCIGGVWAVAASLAVRLVRAESIGRATAVIFSGIAVASVLGVLSGLGLPVDIPKELPRQEILRAMRVDKKKDAARVRFALPLRIGKVELVDVTDLEHVLQHD